MPIALRAGLPRALTQQWLNGYRVDFFLPELGPVVETDGLTGHRTPQQQMEDLLRDQAHTAAGLTRLRFARWQVRFDAARVEDIPTRTRERLGAQLKSAPPRAMTRAIFPRDRPTLPRLQTSHPA